MMKVIVSVCIADETGNADKSIELTAETEG